MDPLDFADLLPLPLGVGGGSGSADRDGGPYEFLRNLKLARPPDDGIGIARSVGVSGAAAVGSVAA